jgi:divalent metal cation (Fe/Co/Zn/Cd) transporter
VVVVEAASTSRSGDLSAAILWCSASVAWAAVAGIASLVAGFVAGSIALVGFGLDSILDGGASATLVWRFRQEAQGQCPGDQLERRAARIVGILLLLVAAYLILRAVVALVEHSGPSASPVGLTLAAASGLVLPVLGSRKLRLAGPLGSQALHADGVLSVAGAALAAAALAGLALSTSLDLWWADSVAALLIAVTLARESVLTLQWAKS